MRYVFKSNEGIRYRFPTHTNELIIDRSESQTSEVFVVLLEPAESPPLHKHDDTEQVFFILDGRGTLTVGQESQTFPLVAGDVVRLPPSTWHAIQADGENMRYLAIDCFPGGRPAAEPTWAAHVQTVCREQGWDYETIAP